MENGGRKRKRNITSETFKIIMLLLLDALFPPKTYLSISKSRARRMINDAYCNRYREEERERGKAG